MVVLTGAGLLVRSFQNLTHVNTGYDRRHVLAFDLTLRPERYRATAPFFETLLSRIRTLPTVRSAAFASVRDFPMTPFGQSSVQIDGLPIPMRQNEYANIRRVGPAYFTTLGISVLRGRGFEEGDRGERPTVILVNNAFVDRYFAGQSPLGRSVNGHFFGRTVFSGAEVIGVVDDVRYFGVDMPSEPEVYVDIDQLPGQTVHRARVAVRTDGDPSDVVGNVRTILRQLDPELRLDGIATMDEIVARSQAVARPRLYALLVGAFATLAVVLAATGLYALMAYSVTERTQEIGIRMALGARDTEVLNYFLKRGAAIALVGLAIGGGVAVWITRYLEKMLFQLSPLDPTTFLIVSAVIGTTAIAASLIPAYRASRVDPLIALRHE
jgi:putative ABC transport system permease protein